MSLLSSIKDTSAAKGCHHNRLNKSLPLVCSGEGSSSPEAPRPLRDRDDAAGEDREVHGRA